MLNECLQPELRLFTLGSSMGYVNLLKLCSKVCVCAHIHFVLKQGWTYCLHMSRAVLQVHETGIPVVSRKQFIKQLSEVRKAWVEEAKSAYIGNPLYSSCFDSDHCLQSFQGEGSGTPAIEWLPVPRTAPHSPHSLWFTQGRWFVEKTIMDQRLFLNHLWAARGRGFVLAKCWCRRKAPLFLVIPLR